MPDVLTMLRLPWNVAGEKEATIVSLLYSLLAVCITGLVIYGAYYGGVTALLLRSMFFSAVAAAAAPQ